MKKLNFEKEKKNLKNFFGKKNFRKILEKIIKKRKKNQFFSKLQIVLEYRVLGFFAWIKVQNVSEKHNLSISEHIER